MTVLPTELIYVKCANAACGQEIAFLKGKHAPPVKTYCEFCCNDVPARINDRPLDNRKLPVIQLDPLPKI